MHLLHRVRRKEASYSLVLDQGTGRKEEYSLSQCCHCALHFRIRPGSGVVRGWCSLCSQPTCGKRTCQSCVPFEQRLARDHARAQIMRALGLA